MDWETIEKIAFILLVIIGAREFFLWFTGIGRITKRLKDIAAELAKPKPNIRQSSCCYLKALQQKGNKEAEKELIKRWGRIPKTQSEAQGCWCCKPTSKNNYFLSTK